MSRELRRVPLDFNWPLNKVWSGYINPHGGPCPEDQTTCFNGYTAAGKWLESVARLIAMLGDEAVCNTPERLKHYAKSGRIYPHPYLQEFAQAPRTSIPDAVINKARELPTMPERMRVVEAYEARNPTRLLPLTDELADLVGGLAKKRGGKAALGEIGSSSVSWEIANVLRDAAGMRKRWGTCPVCKGHGDDPAQRKAANRWRKKHPPKGPGYQLWENVSEGSPISPVFPTRETFIAYLVGEGYTQKAAEGFTESGWAPSMVVSGGVAKMNIEACEDVRP